MCKKHTLYLLLVICIFLQACKEDTVFQETLSNTPTNIILKEKDVSGAYQLVYDFKLFLRQDSLYLDSVQIVSRNGKEATVIFDYRNFDTKGYAAIKYGDGSSSEDNLEIIRFEDKLISKYLPSYNIIDDLEYATYRTDFTLTDSRLFSSYDNPVSGSGSGLSVWNEFFTAVNSPAGFTSFYSQGTPADSLCTVTFYDKPNNTRLLSLSGQKFSFGSLLLPDFDFSTHTSKGRFMVENLPFTQLNMKLVATVDNIRSNSVESYTYAFDTNGRVKKVTIVAKDIFSEENIKEQTLELYY